MARQKGFEPPTFWFVAKHSIQLSYWRFSQLVYYGSCGKICQGLFCIFRLIFNTEQP